MVDIEHSHHELLRRLAEIDRKTGQVTLQLSRIPQAAELEKVQADRREAVRCLGQSTLRLSDVEREISSFETDIARVRDREAHDRELLKSGTVPAKQLVEIEHELETLKLRQTTLEDQEIELLERKEALDAELAQNQSTIDGLDKNISQLEEVVAHAAAGLQQDITQLEVSRGDVTTQLPEDLVALYERIKAESSVAVGHVLTGQCGACFMDLEDEVVSAIEHPTGSVVQQCPMCNAIMLPTAS